MTLCMYHGSQRSKRSATALANHDIVLTSYGCLVADASVLSKVPLSLLVSVCDGCVLA
jgi:hypothetical protein